MARRDPDRSVEAQLAAEERRAVEGLRSELEQLGRELPGADDLEQLTRRHPLLATAAAATLGALLVPTLRGLGRALTPLGRTFGKGPARDLVLRAWARDRRSS